MVKGHYLSVFSEENEKETEDDPWNFEIKDTDQFRIDRSKISSGTSPNPSAIQPTEMGHKDRSRFS
jgi:hypothetical protein